MCYYMSLYKKLLCVPSPFLGLHVWVSSMSRQLTVFMPTPHDVVRIGCITPWSPYPWLHALARITTTLCSCLKPTPLPIVTMTPCYILISLGATTSHDIAPMTPYPCTRHCTLMCFSLLLHLHTSKQQTMALHSCAHCQEGSPLHALCYCGHGLHTTTCLGAHV